MGVWGGMVGEVLVGLGEEVWQKKTKERSTSKAQHGCVLAVLQSLFPPSLSSSLRPLVVAIASEEQPQVEVHTMLTPGCRLCSAVLLQSPMSSDMYELHQRSMSAPTHLPDHPLLSVSLLAKPRPSLQLHGIALLLSFPLPEEID